MARMADVSKLKSNTPRRPIKQSKLRLKSRKRRNKLSIFNTFLILGIYMILLKEYWIDLF